jgi:quinol monooxygenase YgiN
MPGASVHTESTLVTFDEIVVERSDIADLVVSETVDLLGSLRRDPGFVTARVHLSVDRHRVIVRAEWPGDAADAAHGTLASLARREQARAGSTFVGRAAPGLSGPRAGREPGIVAIATRHLRDRAAVDQLMALLSASGEWKRFHPGFIEATPHIGLDEATFVNYPMWTDEKSYRAWMADPKIAEGQEEIARLEVAPPSYVLCTVAAHIANPQ